MHTQQQRIFTSIFYILVGMLIQIWSTLAFADPDIVAQSYASAESPGIQSCTKGYDFLSGDVGYGQTLIKGQLPYTLSYRAPLRENLSSALIMESQEESTSGWTDNYQNYVRSISYSYTTKVYGTLTQSGSTLTASNPTTTTTNGTLYFVRLPGSSEEAVFKYEIIGNTATLTRLYSADPAGDITNLNLTQGTIDSLPWSTNLGEYTFAFQLFSPNLTITRYGATYNVSSGNYTIAASPAYTDTYYGYMNASGFQQSGAIKNSTGYTAPAGATTNAVIIGQVNVGAQTTVIRRVTSVSYPNGQSLSFTYDNNLNVTKVADNRNNVLTFQHNYTQASSLSNQTVHESRAITQVSLTSGSQGDTQTATLNYNAYNVYEPSSGQPVTVYSLASSNSPISGSYTYTHTLTQIGSMQAYVRNFQTGFNATTTPDSDYYFPVLTQVTNALGQIEQQWNITQNYVLKFNPATTGATATPAYYSYSTAQTTLESLRVDANAVANAMDMTTIYDDIAKTTKMSFNLGIVGTGTANVATTVNTTANTSTTGVPNNTSTVTLTTSGTYPCLSVGGKPMLSATFDTLHSRMISSKDGNGNISTYTYDPLSRLSTSTDPLGHVTTYTYTTLNTGATNTTTTPNTVTAPEISVTNVLNSNGQILTQTKSYPQSGSTNQVVNYTYGSGTSLGLVATSTGSRSNLNDTTTYTYDSFGNLANKSSAVINAGTGAQTTYQTVYHNYNSAGIPLSVTNADGSVDTVTLDAGYRTLQTVHTSGSLSQTTSTTYDALERPITSTDADGYTTTTSYDGVGRPSVITDPNGNQVVTAYYTNNTASTVSKENPQGAVFAQTTTYINAAGRVSSKRSGTYARLLTMTYDANGNVTKTTTSLGYTNLWTYDALNRVTSHTDGNGNVDTKAYDDASNNTNANAANSAGSARGFIQRNLVQSEQNTDFGQKTYSYDLDNNVTGRSHVDRNCTFGLIDQSGRPQNTVCTSTTNTGSSFQVNYSYVYDQSAFGNLDQVTSNTSQIGANTSYTYDSLHRLLSKTQTNQRLASAGYTTNQLKTSYTYTIGGKTTSMTYPSGGVLTYNYNAYGVLDNIKLNNQALISTIIYNGAYNLQSFNWGAGSSGSVSLLTDSGGLVTKMANYNSSKALNFIETYNHDNDGRVSTRTKGSVAMNYTYDGDSQLLSESLLNGSSINYTYDSNGNRLTLNGTGTTGLGYSSVTYGYTGNKLNSWSKDGVSQTLGFSNQGELNNTSKGTTTYDNAGRRSSESAVPGSSQYLGMVFDYNHNNERTFRTGSGLDRQYAYDESSHLIGEYTGSGALIVEYVWFNDRPIAAVYPNNRIVYIVTDFQNKPRLGVDATTQQVVWSWDPDAFGALQPATGLANGVEMNLRFPGQYYDVQSGLYYNHNRYYNPELGRYMEPDPLGMVGGLNPYAYTENDPINNIDPSGLLGWDNAAGGIIGLVSGSLSSAAAQYTFNSDHHINLYDVGIAAAVGAGAGFVSPWTAATTGGAVMTGVVAGEYQYLATQLVDKQPITLIGLTVNMAAGAVAGGAGGAVGAAAGKTQVGPSTFISPSLAAGINSTNVGNNIFGTAGRNLGAAGLGASLSSDPVVNEASQQATKLVNQSIYGGFQGSSGFSAACGSYTCTGSFGNQPQFTYPNPFPEP